MRKTATTSAPILPAFAERWSPRSFAQDAVTLEDLKPAFEAARWSASASNTQPWRFYAASKAENPEGFAKLLRLLVPFNASWAQNAAVMLIGVAQTQNAEGKPLEWGVYDLGQAMAAFAAQATAEGYQVHQMGGFDAAASAEALALGEGFQAVIAAAIGKVGSAEALSESLAAREVAERQRKDLSEILLAV